MRPAILVLLAERADHGYALCERLRALGLEKPSDGVYRLLRRTEGEGLVKSSWDIGRAGPPRRIYEITRLGRSALGNWTHYLSSHGGLIDSLVRRCREAALNPDPLLRST
jgi:PadR family transcriptional regulator PadR